MGPPENPTAHSENQEARRRNPVARRSRTRRCLLKRVRAALSFTAGAPALRRPPGDRFLDYAQIKAPNLIGAAHKAGLTVAAITWPVTVGAPAEWNLPEFFSARRGGSMDIRSIESKSNPPDLVKKIAADCPSFAQQWMDDRTRTIAAVWILQHEKPGLMLLHLVDLDSEEHDNAPFTRESYATLEHSDELIGMIVAALVPGTTVAVVSDHGFERVDRIVNVKSVVPDVTESGSILLASDEKTANTLRSLKNDPKYGIGREIPKEEFARFPPNLNANPAAVFDSAEGVMFGNTQNSELVGKPGEVGNHGHWPMRYRWFMFCGEAALLMKFCRKFQSGTLPAGSPRYWESRSEPRPLYRSTWLMSWAIVLVISLQTATAANEYADARTCATCHQKIDAAYRQTELGRSLYKPAPANAIEDYRNRHEFEHVVSATHYSMSVRDGSYYQRRWQIGFDGKETNVEEMKIDFVIGSGNHARSYLHRTVSGGYIELPLGWYAEKGGYWAMSPGFDAAHPQTRRFVSYECVFCHDAYPKIPAGHEAPGEAPVFAGDLPEGIDCQRCHGPGANHIATAQTALAKPGDIRASIVNPARLTPALRLDLCMQCHLQPASGEIPSRIRRFNRGPFSFVPGEPLANFLLVFDHAPGTGHDDRFEIVNSSVPASQVAVFFEEQWRDDVYHLP